MCVHIVINEQYRLSLNLITIMEYILMKFKTFKNMTLSIPLVALLTIPVTGMAETFTGKLNGHGCAHAGTTCPVDRLDPHIALESDFVLQKQDGDYYFLSIPRSTKVRHALEQVQVTGDLNKKYHSIDVDEFRVKKNGKYKVVWSKELQRIELDSLYNSEKYSAPIFLN